MSASFKVDGHRADIVILKAAIAGAALGSPQAILRWLAGSEINANDPPRIPPTSLTTPSAMLTTKPSAAARMASR